MKIVFFDADGTVCHLKYGISDKTKEAIKRLQDNGFHTVLCTSRSMPFVTNDIISLGFEGYITSCGSSIMDKKGVMQNSIPFYDVQNIIDLLSEYDLTAILCGNDFILYDPIQLNSNIDSWFEIISEQIKNKYLPIEKYCPEISVNKICVKIGNKKLSDNDVTVLLKKIEDTLDVDIIEGRGRFGELLEFEIVRRGCNKGYAVSEYINRQECDGEHVESWAIGDDTADIAMFECVDYSIAMGNASDEVKAKAKFITESFLKDGLAKACYDIILKQEIYNKILNFIDISTDGILGYERFLIIDKAKWMDLFISGKMIPPIQIDWQLSSKCNLRCRWCVGQSVTSDNGMAFLNDTMTIDNVRSIADKIVNLQIEGIGVETVQFSGFTGEPLMHWDLLREAIIILKQNKIRIGLFTNGTLMNSSTWDILTEIESVHVSIDGGKKSWGIIKNPKSPKLNYQQIMDNIKGLVQLRNTKKSITEINTGYTVTHENIKELEGTIQDLIDVGADSICIKYDITGNEPLDKRVNYNEVIQQCKDMYGSEVFKVLIMHDEAPNRVKGRWDCAKGCYYRYFFCTIGSDGNIYPCDYQTLSGCPKFGDICDLSLEEAYNNKSDEWSKLVSNNCEFRNVCPPLAEVINPYLNEMFKLIDIYGKEAVVTAIQDVRKNYR